jgi:hypothetical protein
MKFHAVFRHANLLVKNVKEAYTLHPYHPRVRKAPEVRFRLTELGGENLPHLRKVLCLRRTARALAFDGWNLGDHGACNIIRIGQHKVEVVVAVLGGFLFPASNTASTE